MTMTDEQLQHEPGRRRSHRSSTVASTTSSDSLASQHPPTPGGGADGNISSTNANPNRYPPVQMPSDALASLTICPNGSSASSSTSATAMETDSPTASPSPSPTAPTCDAAGPGSGCFSVPRLILTRSQDFIAQNFAGVLRQEIRCTECHKASTREDEFLGGVSVQIPPRNFQDSASASASAGTEEDAMQDEALDPSASPTGGAGSNMHLAPPPPATPTSRSLAAQQGHPLHHSASIGALGGNATFLSTSRSLHHSRSEQCLTTVAQPPVPPSPAAAAAAAARKHHHATVSLQRCLSYTFQQAEVLEGDNAFLCSSCKRKTRAEKRTRIQALPPAYLFVHIGRTVYDTTTFASKKDQTHIAFPLEGLDMSPYLPPWARPASGEGTNKEGALPQQLQQSDYIYDLYAVVNHHGRGLNEGHFTCFGFSQEHACWLLFNDARVNVVPAEKVLESQAYLLFYQRRNAPRADRS